MLILRVCWGQGGRGLPSTALGGRGAGGGAAGVGVCPYVRTVSIRHILYRVRDVEVQLHQIVYLLEQRDDLRSKFTASWYPPPLAKAHDFEQRAIHALVTPVDVVQPCLVNGARVELAAEGKTFGLHALAFGVELPAFAEKIFYALHICEELSLDLTCPDGGTRYWR